MKQLEEQTGKGFGDAKNPLLVSVRSGAAFSMPGMMDTVLNLGLNPETVAGPHRAHRQRALRLGRLASVRRDVRSDRARPARPRTSTSRSTRPSSTAKAKLDTDLTADQLREIGERFTEIVEEKTGEPFPTDPYRQLELAVRAVFDSWFGKRAHDYREFNKIPHDLGTAVNVVTMVFGNMGDDSGTGVAFTRDPNTGERALFGEYLTNAQGEDVVAGVRTPAKISQMRDELPEVYAQFEEIAQRLEGHYRDMQDLEFTIERGTLYMLQTRSGKRTAPAAVKIAVDMVNEGVITKEEALQRVDPAQIVQLLLPRFDEPAKAKVGGPAARQGPERVAGRRGRARRSSTPTARWRPRRPATRSSSSASRPRPDDVHGMLAAKGVLTARGGATSHAAVVARSMGLPVRRRRRVAEDRLREARDARRHGDGRRGRPDQHRRHDRRDLRRRAADDRGALRGRARPRDAPRLGRRRRVASRCGPTPTTRAMRSARARSARRASASAGPSTCSSRRTACRPSGE